MTVNQSSEGVGGVEVLPGMSGPFKADRVEAGWWQVLSADGYSLSAGLGKAAANELARILNSHGAVVKALNGWDSLHKRMVSAGGRDGPMANDMILSFARTQAALLDETKSALSLTQSAHASGDSALSASNSQTKD